MNQFKIRITSLLIITFLFVQVNVQGQTSHKKDLKLTYIANAGFLIEYNSKKILIDALHSWPNFQSTPDEVFSDMLNSHPPFDNIDLILFTHAHPDHYHPVMAELFLLKQKSTVFIAPNNAVELLKISDPDLFMQISDSQIREIDIKIGDVMELSENGIDLKIFGLDHGGSQSNMLNFGFLIEIDDKTLLHEGDAEIKDEFFQSSRHESKNIDVLFADQYLFTHSLRQNIINKFIKPKHIIATHFLLKDLSKASKIIKEKYPDVIIFKKPMESRVFK